MSHNVTEADTFHSTIPVTDINDPNYPTVEADMGQRLADRTRYHQNTLTGAAGTETFTFNGQDAVVTDIVVPADGRANLVRNIGTGLHKQIRWLRERVLGTGSAKTTMRWAAAAVALDSTYWTFDAGTSAFSIKQAALSGTAPVILTVPQVVPGMVISNLRLSVRSPTSHGGVLPNSMPVAYLLSQGAGTATTIASGADTSADAAAYEAVHEIVVTLNYSMTTSDCLVLAVLGENGGSAQANSFRIFRASMDVWYV